MKYGKLDFEELARALELVAAPTRDAAQAQGLEGALQVAAIDAGLADTAAFCEAYDIGLDVSANCVVLEAKRAEKTWYCACIVLATTRADVNGIVRRELGARKISFASMDTATSLTGMEYGGITPVGLPADWQILVDSRVAAQPKVIIGSGIRGSKLLAESGLWGMLPNTTVLDIVRT